MMYFFFLNVENETFFTKGTGVPVRLPRSHYSSTEEHYHMSLQQCFSFRAKNVAFI